MSRIILYYSLALLVAGRTGDDRHEGPRLWEQSASRSPRRRLWACRRTIVWFLTDWARVA